MTAHSCFSGFSGNSGNSGNFSGYSGGTAHVAMLASVLGTLDVATIERWGRRLAEILPGGGRLLVAGNGGSAAEAQHLTAELVGRFRGERPAMSAIALHADTSSLTALGNDYGYDEVFARQVRAHGRAGDALILMSTSGRSPNLIRAAEAARALGVASWAFLGGPGSPLEEVCDEVVTLGSGGVATATVQETHLVAVHILCAAFDAALGVSGDGGGDGSGGGDGGGSGDGDGGGARAAGRTGRPYAAPAPGTPGSPGSPTARRPHHPLVVVGDCLLDRDVTGRAGRLAPDAPVPVLDDLAEAARPGGAGLAALLLARDGHPVTLVTALAPDEPGRRLAVLLAAAGVTVVDLVLEGVTPQKVRIRTDGRSLVRLDHAGSQKILGPLPEAGCRALGAAAAVLVSDYGRGMAGIPSVRAEIRRLRRTPVVWDPHPRGDVPLPGARLVTPNAAEAEAAVPEPAGASLPAVAARGRVLVARWRANAVAITLGSRGALLVADAGTPPLVSPAAPVSSADSCGAGDRFAATATALLGAGALPSESVTVATEVATAFVAAGGAGSLTLTAPSGTGLGDPSLATATATVTAAVVAAGAGPGAGAAVAAGADRDAFALVRRVRAHGGTVVATGGCFDLLHAGHVEVLRAARALGDCLVVCLNSDESVRRLKGPDRPIVPVEDRAAVLRSLASVDAVAVFDEDTPARLLTELGPDIFAKGGDYAVADLPEAEVLASWGGQAVVLPYLAGRSTTLMIEEAVRRGSR